MRSVARSIAVRLMLTAAYILAMGILRAAAMPSTAAPLLPPPTGRVVKVSSEPELQDAVRSLASDTTIVLAPGVYKLTRTLWLEGKSNVAIRGATSDRDAVVLQGPGMTVRTHDVLFGVASANVRGLLIAN